MFADPPLAALARRFRRVWAIDFEFRKPEGERDPEPRCIVALDLLTGDRIRRWFDPRDPATLECPFRCDGSELFVAYYATAEASCFLALRWPRPTPMLDAYVEFRSTVNGTPPAHHYGLIGALAYFGLPAIGGEEKDEMRALAMREGPSGDYTAAERSALLDYCQSDVDALARLLPRIAGPARLDDARGLNQTLHRGRYMVALAQVEANGVPLDVDLLGRIMENWEAIKLRLIGEIDPAYGAYVDGSFSERAFEAYLAAERIPWPRLDSGRLDLKDDTFHDQARRHPQLYDLRELRHALGQLRLNSLAIGSDGRNRAMLSAFRATTGRNQPSNSKFIFGPAVWLRHAIRSRPGRGFAYLDWSAQEIAIAAALSGDERMWGDYASGDPYLSFAKLAGLAPADATKKTHPTERDACKTLLLGLGYGMSDYGLAERAGLHILSARDLMRRHRAVYPTFWAWSDGMVNRALAGFPLETVFGWRMQWRPGTTAAPKDTAARNWPMQANGAEMMRLAVTMAAEAGLMLCAPVHDALLIEAPADRIEADVERARTIMGDASEMVLGPGKRIRVGGDSIVHPDRYVDARGVRMFETVTRLLADIEREAGYLPASVV